MRPRRFARRAGEITARSRPRGSPDTRAAAHAAFLEQIGLRSSGLTNDELAAAVMNCGHERVAEFVAFLLTHLAYVQIGPIPIGSDHGVNADR